MSFDDHDVVLLRDAVDLSGWLWRRLSQVSRATGLISSRSRRFRVLVSTYLVHELTGQVERDLVDTADVPINIYDVEEVPRPRHRVPHGTGGVTCGDDVLFQARRYVNGDLFESVVRAMREDSERENERAAAVDSQPAPSQVGLEFRLERAFVDAAVVIELYREGD